MKLEGWIFLIASWSVIIGLFFYCMVRTMRQKSAPDKGQQPPDAG